MRTASKTVFISIFFLMLLLMLNSVSSLSNLGMNTSGFDATYLGETGFFNNQLEQSGDASIIARALNNGEYHPLVADLDNDGKNEIVVLDSPRVRLYHDNTLDIVDTYLSPNMTTDVFMTLYDIDDDGFIEILMSDNEAVEIVEYNGTSFSSIAFDFDTTQNTAGWSMVACREKEECLVVFTLNKGQATNAIYAKGFNSTDTGNRLILDSDTVAPILLYCLSRHRHISVADYDSHLGDGMTEFIATSTKFATSNIVDEKYYIFWIGMYDNLTSFEEHEAIINIGDETSVSATLCDTGYYDRYFSSPLVAELTESSGDGLETVIAFQEDDDKFRMFTYDSAGNFIDDYPEILQVDGILISNVIHFEGESFPFCVIGYDSANNQNNLLCGSETNQFGLFESIVFESTTNPFNITTNDYLNSNIMGYAVDMSSVDDPNDLELLGSHGVWEVDTSTLNVLTGYGDMGLIYDLNNQHGITEAAVIPVDVQQVGRNDLIAMTDTSVYYIDDGFTNSPAQITSYTIDPCLDSTWKQNTTVSVSIQVTDPDSDSVNAESLLYYNEANEQQAISINSSSGTTFVFGFEANTTTGSSTLRLIGRDTVNTEEDIIDLSYSVSTEGVVFGDCSTSVEIGIEEEDEAEGVIPGTTIPTNNSVSQLVDQFEVITNLPASILWLLVMVFLAIGVVFGGAKVKMHPVLILSSLAFMEIIMIIIGVRLAFLGFGTLLILVIMLILIVLFALRKLLFSSSEIQA